MMFPCFLPPLCFDPPLLVCHFFAYNQRHRTPRQLSWNGIFPHHRGNAQGLILSHPKICGRECRTHAVAWCCFSKGSGKHDPFPTINCNLGVKSTPMHSQWYAMQMGGIDKKMAVANVLVVYRGRMRRGSYCRKGMCFCL